MNIVIAYIYAFATTIIYTDLSLCSGRILFVAILLRPIKVSWQHWHLMH